MFIPFVTIYSESSEDEVVEKKEYVFQTKKEAIEAFKNLLRDKVCVQLFNIKIASKFHSTMRCIYTWSCLIPDLCSMKTILLSIFVFMCKLYMND